jgi:SAM-dependent methyltransferase
VLDLYRCAFSYEYPDGIEVFSSCTKSTLDRAMARLRLPPAGVVVDLGCGSGGPGRWLALKSGACLVGVDFSRIALEMAAKLAADCLEPGRFDYRHGTFAATGLPDMCADGVVSIDAFPMNDDPRAALGELHRILRPGARAFFTCGERPHADGRPASGSATRWASLIEKAGLDLVEVHVDQGNRERWLAVYALWLRHEAELRECLGAAAENLLHEAREAPGSALPPGYRALQLTVEGPGV